MSLDPRRRVLYGVLAVGLALGAWAHLRALPAIKRARELRERLAAPPPAEPATTPAALEAELARLRADVAALRSTTSPGALAAGPELEVALAGLAARAGLAVDRFETHASPAPPQQRGGAPAAAPSAPAAASRKIILRGDFFGLRAFLAELAAAPRGLAIAALAVELDPAPRDPARPLSIQLEVAP